MLSRLAPRRAGVSRTLSGIQMPRESPGVACKPRLFHFDLCTYGVDNLYRLRKREPEKVQLTTVNPFRSFFFSLFKLSSYFSSKWRRYRRSTL